MQKFLLFLFAIPAILAYLIPNPLAAQSRPTQMAARIFKTVKTKLSVDDKNAIATSLGKVASATEADVYPLDLNNDGTEEVFVALMNPDIYGNAGGETVLLQKMPLVTTIKHKPFPPPPSSSYLHPSANTPIFFSVVPGCLHQNGNGTAMPIPSLNNFLPSTT